MEINYELGNELIAAAKEMGAVDAKIFTLDQVCFDSRVILKCLYGCGSHMPYCPTKQDVLNPVSMMEIAKKYSWGVIVNTDNVKLGQDITLKLESKAFLAGKYFAFATTECENCAKCSAEENGHCVNLPNVRPPLYGFGIDVYQTVRNVGWEIEVVQKKGDPRKNITAVFVE